MDTARACRCLHSASTCCRYHGSDPWPRHVTGSSWDVSRERSWLSRALDCGNDEWTSNVSGNYSCLQHQRELGVRRLGLGWSATLFWIGLRSRCDVTVTGHAECAQVLNVRYFKNTLHTATTWVLSMGWPRDYIPNGSSRTPCRRTPCRRTPCIRIPRTTCRRRRTWRKADVVS